MFNAYVCRYNHGLGVSTDAETAAQYGSRAAAAASAEYHRAGGQPVMEADRIDDNTEKEVRIEVVVEVETRDTT
jgi:hypothetical protein